ncbi:MAG TPA: glycosyltransferase family 39 protein [Opitutaceae bacterium]|nr:glycosyltransferase family 39 protein [Opitutaceae bacterium]
MEQAKLEAPGAVPEPPRRARAARALGAALAIAFLAWMAAVGTRLAGELSVTRDEPGHLSAGLSAWRGDYRQSTGNLFFAQKWAAWPLVGGGLRPPNEELQRGLDWNPLLIGEAILFSGPGDPRGILAPARRMTLLLCVLTGVLVWGWAARLGGPLAGAFAALLYATSPVIIANGVLATTDTGAAFWYLSALAAYAWLLRRPSALPAASAGFCAAMMLLSKFSIVAWMAGALLLLAWHLSRRRARTSLLPLAGWHAAACAVAWVTVWAFFGWEFRPGGFAYMDLAPPTAVGRLVGLLGRWRALPEPFLREVLMFQDMMKPRPAYLLGEFRVGGFWDYFPVAFLVKSTVAMLLALAAWPFVRRTAAADAEGSSPSIAPVAAGAIGFAAVAMLAPINIGVRHILPLFPLAAVAGGVALARLSRLGPLPRALAALVALLAAYEGFSARRQPLAWFNAAAGGPMSGFKIMVDSSLEWGGDLPDLIAWERNMRTADRDTPLFVCLLGPPGHEHFGLPATNMEWAFENGRIRAGYFVFGATRLVGGPTELYGEWTETMRRQWVAEGSPAWRGPLPHPLAQLAVARIAASCRRLKPDERIGPVYFVYRLDERALERALGADADSLPLVKGPG